MRSKNAFTLFFASVLAIVLIASTFAMIMSGMKEEPTKVSVVVVNSQDQRWASFYDGLEQAAKDYNVKLNIVSTAGSLSLDKQRTLLNQEINDGAKGLIVQFDNSNGTRNLISDLSRKAVLELVDTSAEADVDVEGRYACIEADNYGIGRAIASEVRITVGADLSNYNIGIVTGNQKQFALQERLNGFVDSIESTGAKIVWQIGSLNNITNAINYRQEQTQRADIIVALSNEGLEGACEYKLWTEEEVFIFGEGNSIKNVSYVDHGLINSMIVTNDYYMGYQSLVAVCARLDNKLTPMENQLVPYRVVNKENLFSEANQRLLFPIG